MQPTEGQIKRGSVAAFLFVLKTDPAFHPALQLAGTGGERRGREISRP